MAEEKKLTELSLKEKIKGCAEQLDKIRAEITALRTKLTEKEDEGKQVVGGMKVLQGLVREMQ